MNKTLPVLALALSLGFVGAFSFADADINPSQQIFDVNEQDSMAVQGQVQAQLNGEQVAFEDNVMLDGESIIVELLTEEESFTYSTIAVGDGEVPESGDTELDGRIETDGLGPSEGSVVKEDESYEVEVTYTAAGTQDVSTTALEIDTDYDGQTDFNTFAATDFGRTIPMEDGDELTVTWEIDPQNP